MTKKTIGENLVFGTWVSILAVSIVIVAMAVATVLFPNGKNQGVFTAKYEYFLEMPYNSGDLDTTEEYFLAIVIDGKFYQFLNNDSNAPSILSTLVVGNSYKFNAVNHGAAQLPTINSSEIWPVQ